MSRTGKEGHGWERNINKHKRFLTTSVDCEGRSGSRIGGQHSRWRETPITKREGGKEVGGGRAGGTNPEGLCGMLSFVFILRAKENMDGLLLDN